MKRPTQAVHIDLDLFRLTESGKQKIWRTDMVPTFCCELTPSYFVWERSTKYNDYQPYSGYIHSKHIHPVTPTPKQEKAQ